MHAIVLAMIMFLFRGKEMRTLTLLLGSLLLWSPGFASVALQDNFIRTGQTETLTAALTQFGGVTTIQQWSGLVEVIVSGEAINNPPTGLHVDPFWAFSPSTPNTVQGTGHRLRLSFTGCAAAFECGAPDIVLFMTFVDGVGPVNPPAVASLDPLPLNEVMPLLQGIVPYNVANHTYRFVIDVGATPKLLTLGDGDGGVSDNSGQFAVQLFSITQVIPFGSLASSVSAKMKLGGNNDSIKIDASFKLGASSDGINPLTEDVTIEVGNVSQTITGGLFRQTKPGVFMFDGSTGSSNLKATIKAVKNGFQLDAQITGVDLNESELPLTFGLMIGNEAGTSVLGNAALTASSE